MFVCRFPLLLHYLEQQESIEIQQWHNWLLDLLTGAGIFIPLGRYSGVDGRRKRQRYICQQNGRVVR